jgi:hypothetical protein
MLALLAVPSMAQQRIIISDTTSYEIHFRWDKSRLDTNYLGNDRTFKTLAQDIDSIGVNKIDSVVIVSQSSPEGPYYYNQNLSARRAATMRGYMERRHPEVRDRLTVNPDGESWEQLRHYIALDKKLSPGTKRRLYNIINDRSVPIEIKKRRLSNDVAYRYLYKKYYPIIRNSRIQVVYQKLNFEKYGPMQLPEPTFHKQAPKANIEPLKVIARQLFTPDTVMLFACKTNLLYDAVTALNFELEMPIGNHWSVAVEDVFPWWETGNKYCLQMWEIGAEARYWFRNNKYYAQKLQGHFLGLYGMSSKFDFQNDYDICYQGEYWSAGLTYGYSMKLTRHLNMEFSLSVGYLSSSYRHYYPADDYGLLWRDKSKVGRISYIGPTKVKVALVWPIRIPYKKKGGVL